MGVALGELRDRAAVPYLLVALGAQSHPLIRHKAIEAMGIIGDESVIPTLEKASQVAKKTRDKETAGLAKLAILETKRDLQGVEAILGAKRVKEWMRPCAEAAQARLREEQDKKDAEEARIRAEQDISL